jgi:DNA-directed RNA polymerase I subunit RPA2
MGLHTREQCLAYLGSRFRAVALRTDARSDAALGGETINRHVLVHLRRHEDKQEALLHMLKKVRCRQRFAYSMKGGTA